MLSLHLRSTLMLVLGVALVAALGLAIHRSRQLTDCRRQREADRHSLEQLRDVIRQRDLQKAPAVAEEGLPAGDNRAALARRDANITLLNHQLSEAHGNIMQLQAQLASANNDRLKALAEANERDRKQLEDWQNRLDTLQRDLHSAETQSEASRQRLASLETDNSKLRNDLGQNAARASELAHVAASLQDLDRRRDIYLTSVIRQYREITSQFRAMTGMLDSSRDQTSGAFNGAALTRIQNAISLADDDLRQLNDLNAQAHQLEKKLMKK